MRQTADGLQWARRTGIETKADDLASYGGAIETATHLITPVEQSGALMDIWRGLTMVWRMRENRANKMLTLFATHDHFEATPEEASPTPKYGRQFIAFMHKDGAAKALHWVVVLAMACCAGY